MSKKTNLPEPIGLILIFVFGFSFIFASELIILKCNRLELNQKVICEVTHFGLRGKRITVIPAGELQSAKKELIGDKRSSGYQIFLLTEYDKIPIKDVFSDPGELIVNQKVDQINNFLNNPEQISLKMLQHPNWYIVLAGIIFMSSSILVFVLKFPDYRERRAKIRRIQREISYPYHKNDKSDIS